MKCDALQNLKKNIVAPITLSNHLWINPDFFSPSHELFLSFNWIMLSSKEFLLNIL